MIKSVNLKHAVDLAVVLLIFPLIVPIIIVISGLIFVKLGRPVFFLQDRPGYKSKIFKLRKFRTMTSERDQGGDLLPDAERLTRFGRFLRLTSLDEIPSFLNVLTGDMSIVGPRPLLPGYLPLYTSRQLRRHDVRPGITGWAQVNGRNNLTWEEKFEFDVWYVDHRSFFLDMRILVLTVVKVLKRENVSQSGEATMSLFTGGKQETP